METFHIARSYARFPSCVRFDHNHTLILALLSYCVSIDILMCIYITSVDIKKNEFEYDTNVVVMLSERERAEGPLAQFWTRSVQNFTKLFHM